MKRIAILTLGTRGDVQPYIALALGLQQRGFRPRIVAPVNFDGFLREHGLEHWPIEMNTEEGLKSAEGRAWLASGNSRAFLRHLGKLMQRDATALRRGIWEACQETDAIVGTAMTLAEGLSVAEKLDLPFLASLLYPVLPASRHYPQYFVTTKPSPLKLVNYLTHTMFQHAWWRDNRDALNRWRGSIGLAPLRHSAIDQIEKRKILTLHNYSETLFPRPADWPANHVLTGPMFLSNNGAALSTPLLEFLRAGEPPVFLGFGSMPILDPGAALEMTARAAGRLGIRAVIGFGWSDFPAYQNGHLFLTRSADHNQLFPLCRALVHHGGAGTTFTGIRAGVPAVIFSVFADQPLWGERLSRTGAGIHFPFRRFSEETLSAGLRHVLRLEAQACAQELSKRIAAESGVATSVARIEQLLSIRGSGAAQL